MGIQLNRRQLLGGGLLFVGAWVSAQLFGHRPLTSPTHGPFLGDSARGTLEAAFRFFLPTPEQASHYTGEVDRFLAEGDPLLGGQLILALWVLEHLGGFGPLSFRRFSRRSAEAQAEVLMAWEVSGIGLKRQIFQALRKTTLFTCYSDPAQWTRLGYEGPWISTSP